MADPIASSTLPRAAPLGFWTATALVVGNMIGSGLFLLPSALAVYGSASFLGWACSGVGALLLAAVFARLSQLYPHSGGPYTFARAAFGDAIGFIVGWSYWISVWSAIPAIAIAFAGYAGAVFPALTATPLRSTVTAVITLLACVLVNARGLRTAGGLQLLTTGFKVGVLVIFAAAGLLLADPAHFRPFNPSQQPLWQVTAATSALTLWAFMGLESATIPAGAVANADRTVPRATLAGTAIAIVITIAACTAVAGMVPADLLKASASPFTDAISRLLGDSAAIAVSVLAAVACLGALNGWVLMLGQMPQAIARDGLFPAFFARGSARGVPVIGLAAGAVLATILIAANYQASLVSLFTWAILLSTAACLLPYLVCALALVTLEPRRLWLRLAGVAAAIYTALALAGAGREALAWGAGLVAGGVPLYLWQRYRTQ
ncbi:amino acid permease [Tahibacter amnicola]|uniref:Arginine/agmatine antiporter n=1 Tax=Tahibacter amnicola TaxID=2976241 RepID=A0ABY6BII8_9GAMM|nr:amino acid permease [Tahibacter amnicola]UXI69831.1 amino acid permease [Tahibacter amnicola]